MKLLSLATPISLLCAGLLSAPVAPVNADLHAIVQVIHHVPAHLHSALASLPELNDAPAEEEMMELPELIQQMFQPKAVSRWSNAMERIHQLPATTADDIMSSVASFQQRSAPVHHAVQDDGDDYPQCEEVIYETAQHLINGTIDFIEKKCANESLPEKAKQVCKFLTTHEEGVAGFITGFAQPYVLAYFYAAGNGSCPLHPFPVNSTSFSISSNLDIGHYNPNSWLQTLVDDNEFDIMTEMYSMSDDDEDVALPQLSGASAEWSSFFRHLLPVDQQESLSKQLQGGGDDDDDKCKKCYMKVVSKYIKVVRQLRARYCEKTKCDYIKNEVCKYLDEHQEFEVGLILGALRPFKFAAGYCMGSKKCVPHNVTQMAIEGSFAAVQLML